MEKVELPAVLQDQTGSTIIQATCACLRLVEHRSLSTIEPIVAGLRPR